MTFFHQGHDWFSRFLKLATICSLKTWSSSKFFLLVIYWSMLNLVRLLLNLNIFLKQLRNCFRSTVLNFYLSLNFICPEFYFGSKKDICNKYVFFNILFLNTRMYAQHNLLYGLHSFHEHYANLNLFASDHHRYSFLGKQFQLRNQIIE